MKMFEYECLRSDNTTGFGYLKAENKKEALEILNTNKEILSVYKIDEVVNNTLINKFRYNLQKQKIIKEEKKLLKLQEEKEQEVNHPEASIIDYTKELRVTDAEETTNVVKKPLLNLEFEDIKRAIKGEIKLKIGSIRQNETGFRKIVSGIVDTEMLKEASKNKDKQKKLANKDNYNKILKQKETGFGEANGTENVFFGETLLKLNTQEKSLDSFLDSSNKEKGLFDTTQLEREVGVKIKLIKKYKNFKVKDKDLLLFCKRLQLMLSSGLTILRALEILENSSGKKMKVVITTILTNIRSGANFSQTLKMFPRVFDEQFVAMIEVGETSGALNEVLVDLIDHLEKSLAVKKKIKTASIYPAIIMFVFILFMIGGSIFMIPKFRDMFAEQEISLPVLTQIVFGIADKLPIIGAVIFGIIILLIVLSKTNQKFQDAITERISAMVLKLPVVKQVAISSYMYSFSATMAMMLNNGIKLSETLDLVRRGIKNRIVQREVEDIKVLINQGLTLPEAMMEQTHFDTILTSTTMVGFQTGKLNESLTEIAKYYNNEVDEKISQAVELVQPITILLIGLIIGPTIVAIYLPILQMSTGSLL